MVCLSEPHQTKFTISDRTTIPVAFSNSFLLRRSWPLLSSTCREQTSILIFKSHNLICGPSIPVVHLHHRFLTRYCFRKECNCWFSSSVVCGNSSSVIPSLYDNSQFSQFVCLFASKKWFRLVIPAAPVSVNTTHFLVHRFVFIPPCNAQICSKRNAQNQYIPKRVDCKDCRPFGRLHRSLKIKRYYRDE
ncbi:hypothetical protein BT69DRAFT_962893 [Atractiella rhizophila]|nr:hypothetical protein BT69DRAFT_962893 [Atractiella rhizophila]